MLRDKRLLTQNEIDTIFQESPFQTQKDIRSDRFWAVTIPVPPEESGVKPLLESWGGESAYFHLRNEDIEEKLKSIGQPRIVEVETHLHDFHSAYNVAPDVSRAWAASKDIAVKTEGCDLAIKDCQAVRVLKIHTEGDGIFERVGKTYPDGAA